MKDAMMIQNPQQVVRGMHTDNQIKFQPEGTYLFALNAILESLQGDRGSLINALGNELAGTLPADHVLIGAQKLDNHEFLIFHTNEIDSIISLYDPITQAVAEVMDATCLAFDPRYPMRTLFKIHRGCERLVFFTDNKNPYRVINLDKLSNYSNGMGGWDCGKLKLSRNIEYYPCFDSLQVLEGGGDGLLVGTYQFAVRYLDEDLNPTNWIMISQPVSLIDDSIGTDYDTRDGARPLTSGNPDKQGAVPATNKSIKINLTNLDTSFTYYQIASVHITSETAFPSQVLEHPRQPVRGTTSSYTFAGEDNAVIGVAEDIIIDNLIIDRVKDNAQLDSTHYISNLSSDTYDWASVQRLANEITSRWKTMGIENGSTMDMKHPTYMFNNYSYMRDEVYAFGIMGRMVNGDVTPVFHIPGTAPDTVERDRVVGNLNLHSRNQVPLAEPWDTQLLDVTDLNGLPKSLYIKIEQVEHLGFTDITDDIGYGAGKVPRWKVYNTAIRDVDSAAQQEGYMAYWESSIDYLDTEDCEGTRIYPEGKIRHHKFPDTTLSRHVYNDHKSLMGITFDIDSFIAGLPTEVSDNVVSWEIVRADRTPDDTSVLDKGLIFQQPKDLDEHPHPHNSTETGADPFDYYANIYNFYSPKTLLNRDYLNATHMKIELEALVTTLTDNTENTTGHFVDYENTIITSDILNVYPTNVPITSSIFIDRAPAYYPDEGGVPTNGYPTVEDNHAGNVVQNNHYTIHKFNTLFGVDLSLSYDHFTRFPLYDADGRDTLYVSYKNYNPNAYGRVEDLEYYACMNCPNYTTGDTVYGGDTFISKWNVQQSFTRKYGPEGVPGDFWNPITFSDIVTMYTESTVNAELRSGIDAGMKPFYNAYAPAGALGTAAREDFIDITNLPTPYQETPPDAIEYIEFLDYNPDYSRTNTLKPYFPLADTFDYCSDCSYDYPYRIAYSETAQQESISDNYRQFRVNNYRDLIGVTGHINALETFNNNLYAFTDKSPYFVPTRPQSITSNEANIFIGTGDLLSIPPQRIGSPNFTYGGCDDPLSLISSEFGITYVDERYASIFHLSKGLDEISGEGMKQWFKTNLPLKLNRQHRIIYGTDYPCRYTTDRDGIGFVATYDPLFRRYILTKKDYRVIDSVNTVYNPTSHEWINNLTDARVYLDDPEFFENHSWTIAYSYPHKSWISFYSYLPSYIFGDEYNFYTSRSTGNNFYIHNQPNYQTYYGVKYDHIIDLVINPNPNVNMTFDSFNLNVTIEKEDGDTLNEVDSTFFYKGAFWNSYQSTGYKNLVPKTNEWDQIQINDNIIVNKNENDWTFHNLRDKITDHTKPLWTNDWDEIQSDYYINRIPNPELFLTQRNLFNQSRMRDKYLGARLMFKPDSNFKITTDIINTNTSVSYR